MHKFEKLDFDFSDEKIEEYASIYVKLRSHLKNIEDIDVDPRFKNLGFNTDKIKKILKANTIPIRTRDKGVHRDIYRSDFGELLLTLFFDKEYHSIGESFIIPIKNIWDREHNDLPGRGIDVTGYQIDSGKIKLLLGEGKVSGENNSPPQSSNEIYKEQKKYIAQDQTYLKRRLSNYSKKTTAEDSKILTMVLFAIEDKLDNVYEIVHGCCLVRDINCYREEDFGKMKSKQNEFESNEIHFIIPVLDRSIEDTIDVFYKKVIDIANG